MNTFSNCKAKLSGIAEQWLGEKRLAPSSRLAKRLRTYIHDELSKGWRVNDLILPNPYHYFTCAAPEEDPVLNNAMRGPQHGDFNQNNILIQFHGKGYFYYLIDFSYYQSQTFLFFDQAYLLLDILLDIDSLLLADWIKYLQEFFTALSNGLSYTGSAGTFGKFAAAFIQGWKRFYSRYPNNGKELMLQLLCACAAVGLNFMHKSMARKNKQIFSLLFSSLALKSLMDLGAYTPLDITEEYPELNIASTGGLSTLWNITDGFSETSRYILISSCLPEYIHPNSFCTLEPVHWTAVIEVNHLLENSLRDMAFRICLKGVMSMLLVWFSVSTPSFRAMYRT